MSPRRRGFSLIQLLVIIAILAFLMALLVPAVQKVREAAARNVVINNLKQVCLAMHNINDVYKQLPPATAKFGGINNSDQTISVHMLPYIEQAALYNVIQGGKAPPTTVVIPPYNSPLDFTTTDFVRVQNICANVRIFTNDGVATAWDKAVALKSPMPCNSAIPRTFVDGTSQTICFATRYAASGTASTGGKAMTPCGYYDLPLANDGGSFFGATPMAKEASPTATSGWQLAPSLAQVNCAFAAGLGHSFGLGGIQVGLGDASVRTVSPAVTVTTWNYAMCPNDGNPLGNDW